GRRYVVAHANDPELGDPRGLSRRERQVAEYIGLGRSLKEIAYLLGLGPSAITNAAARACAKLGMRGHAELGLFFAPNGPRAQLEAMGLAGESLAVGSMPLVDESLLERLSEAERSVTHDLLRGFTVAAIARRRDASPHTVSTQVKSIYRKLGVGSRLELATRLVARRA
ncbi:helix-turn-helix transcriptional regulator, partial [Myxococcota bacterium]|nr:helix-turn-helix transcriptional regulator [Myxococcota bacterium]